MQKRVVFNNRQCLSLLAPQIVVTMLFFFWPAGQAIYQSAFISRSLRSSVPSSSAGVISEFLLGDPYYLASFKTTVVFSTLVTSPWAPRSGFAVMADRVIKGSSAYKTLLVWPYAVAPAVAGVLCSSCSIPNVGLVAWYLGGWL
ncbi:MAG: hypothetical protein HPM95_21085 [Alphaproteobacteria bacterium]|nr:hypothetical protein [Alphaproteobacteria bacterium]